MVCSIRGFVYVDRDSLFAVNDFQRTFTRTAVTPVRTAPLRTRCVNGLLCLCALNADERYFFIFKHQPQKAQAT